MGICQRIVYISYPDSLENKPLPSRIVRGNREAASQKIDYPLFKIFKYSAKVRFVSLEGKTDFMMLVI